MAENDDMRVPDRAHDARSADLAKASHWQRKGGRLAAAVERRFGVLPNFFGPATANPEITKSLRDFACFAYLDNPLPSLFKERLFVYLARFCDVRCCIGRHVGFLVGLGRPSGDPLSPTRNIAEVLRLVQRPLRATGNWTRW